MNIRHASVAAINTAFALFTGCASTRGDEATGGYIDDAAITSTVKARMVEDKAVDSGTIQVETLHGKVLLSGVVRSTLEKQTAENIAIKVRGVKLVQNDVAVRP